MIQDFSDGYCLAETTVVPHTEKYASVAPDYYREICMATGADRVVVKIESNHIEATVDGAMPDETVAVPYAYRTFIEAGVPVLFARKSGVDVLVENGLIGEHGPI